MAEGELSGQVAVVTGGTKGIGRACALALMDAGARVHVGSRSAANSAERAALSGALPGIGVGALDVTDDASVRSFVDAVTREDGAPSILVNAAGVTVHAPVTELADADWQAVIDANLTGAFRMIRAVMGPMMQAGRGRIVNIGSTAARKGMPLYAAYCASKAGLLGLTRCVALEGAPRGVTCVAVSPTWVETEMLQAAAAETAEKEGRPVAEVIAGIAASNPQHRLVQPGEIAALVAFLCGDGAPGLTMEDIQINAGADW